MWIPIVVTLAILLTLTPLWDDDDRRGRGPSVPHWVEDPDSYFPELPSPKIVAAGKSRISPLRGESWARTRALAQARTRLAYKLTKESPHRHQNDPRLVQVDLENIGHLAQWKSPEGDLHVLIGLPR